MCSQFVAEGLQPLDENFGKRNIFQHVKMAIFGNDVISVSYNSAIYKFIVVNVGSNQAKSILSVNA